ncbi:MAG: hypothetical protein JW738_00625 [Actinobacteria bacterium]|nr:hypothetical protein [Actinomycetota bacterium]
MFRKNHLTCLVPELEKENGAVSSRTSMSGDIMITVSRTYLDKLRKEADRIVELLSECIVIANYLRQIAVEGSENEIDEVIRLVEDETVIFNSLTMAVGRIYRLQDFVENGDEEGTLSVRDVCSLVEDSSREVLYNRCVIVSKMVDAVRKVYGNNEKLFISLTGMFQKLDKRISGQNGKSSEAAESIKRCVQSYLDGEDPASFRERIDTDLDQARDFSHDSYYFNWKKSPLLNGAQGSAGSTAPNGKSDSPGLSGGKPVDNQKRSDFGTVSLVYRAAADASGAVGKVLNSVVDCFGIPEI